TAKEALERGWPALGADDHQLGMKAVVPVMERSGGGSIVNISSVACLKGSPGSFAYAATKWALRGMTKSAAIDLGGRKIRVNSVHPGPIDTDMIAFRRPEQREERMRQVPMHRRGTPEEVAQLVAFLLSDELWASALREVKARMRPLFQQERICLLRS